MVATPTYYYPLLRELLELLMGARAVPKIIHL